VALWWAEHAWLGGARTDRGVLLDVKDDRIASVTTGTGVAPRGANRLPGLTLPGLANAHSHAFHRALRGRTHERSGSFWSWRELMYSVASRVEPDGYLRLARAVYAEMALAGFTAVGEFHYLHHGPGGVPYDDPNEMGLALVEAAASAGIRLTLLDALYLRGGFERPLEGPQLRFGDRDAAGWADRVSRLDDTDRVRIGAAIHSIRAVAPADAVEAAKWASSAGRPLHAHVSEQRDEHDGCVAFHGRTPLAALDEAGALSSDFTAVHGNHFSPEDVFLLASTGGGCCACPTTERDLGDGIGPFRALHSAGVALSVGTDSHAQIDGFEEARAIEMDARSAGETRGVFAPFALGEAATVGGMTALGWDAGSLAPGRLADFVNIRMDSVRTAGVDPGLVAAAILAASAADVVTVVVGGKPIVADGKHLFVDEVERELADSIRSLIQ
jgi:formiminoglutamate deiminase